MKAKKVYENIGKVLAPKSKEELAHSVKDLLGMDEDIISVLIRKPGVDYVETRLNRAKKTFNLQEEPYKNYVNHEWIKFTGHIVDVFNFTKAYFSHKGTHSTKYHILWSRDRIAGKKLAEGVGDAYAEKRFGIPNEFNNFDKRFKMKKEEDIIGYVNETPILKNPQSLQNIPTNAKGLIDKEGNMYFCDPKKAIHWQMIEVLVDKNIIPLINNWNVITPIDFLTVQRQGDTNTIAVGESNRYDFSDPIIINAIEHLFDKAEEKNDIWLFVNKSIRSYNKIYYESKES